MASRSLTDVLQIQRDMRVAAIGGGGKMTLLTTLGLEWARQGGRPVLIPTTRLFQTDDELAGDVRTIALPPALTSWPPLGASPGKLIIIGRKSDKAGLLEAIQPDEISILAQAVQADLILLKADGSRGRSLKVHEEGEPVVPIETNLVVAVAGLDVWGAELSAETVHRSELFAARWSMVPGERLEDEAFLMALSDPAGYRASVPSGARYLVFLNKADRPVRVAIAQRLAQALHERGVPEVAWGDIRRDEWTAFRKSSR